MTSNRVLTAAMAGALAATSLTILGAHSAPAASTGSQSTPAADVVDVGMAEYAFTVSGPLKAGGTLRIRNAGKELHMVGVSKLLPGKTLDDMKKVIGTNDKKAFATVAQEVSLPGAIVTPGHSVEITVPTLAAGTYALICFMPAESDGKAHFEHGMITTLTVTADKATLPKPDATYSVTVGKPITGPTTLTAGHHVLQIDAGPGTDQLEPGLVRLTPGVTLEATVRKIDALFGANDGKLPKGAGTIVSKLLDFAAHDFKTDRRVYLGVDLKPGRYALGAPDTDVEKKPAHFAEQITIKVA